MAVVFIVCLLAWWMSGNVDCATVVNMASVVERDTVYDNNSCVIVKECMSCVEIPSVIPKGIRLVIVTNHSSDTIDNTFLDKTWNRVALLNLTAPYVHTISSKSFVGLGRLQELILDLPEAYILNNDSFNGLTNLNGMHVLNSRMLTSTLMESVSARRSLMHLQKFTFNPGKTSGQSPLLFMSEQIVDRVLYKPLTTVNISNTALNLNLISLAKIFLSSISVMNLSDSTVLQVDSLSSLDNYDGLQELLLDKVGDVKKPIFKVLDLNGIVFPFVPAKKGAPLNIHRIQIGPFAMLVETLYFNRVLKDFDSIMVFNTDFTNRTVFLKSVSIRQNNIISINSSISLNKNNPLSYVDLSDNKIAYISPAFGNTAVNMREIYLSNNRLYKMEHSHELDTILRSFKKLQILDLSKNNISIISKNMFRYLEQLEILNLSSNRLTTINFDLDGLISLVKLDVQNNEIHFIADLELSALQTYMKNRRNTAKPADLDIDFRGNPLLCTCSTLPFIQWLTVFSKQKCVCSYGDLTIAVNENAVAKCHYLCIRKMTIIGSVIGAVVILMVISITVAHTVKTCRKEKQIILEKRLQEAVEKGEDGKDRFIAFACFTDEDKSNLRACRLFLNNLGASVKQRLHINKEPLSTSDDIKANESVRSVSADFIDKSMVFIAFVSSSFCKDYHCSLALTHALEESKPLILIFISENEEIDITQKMQINLPRYTRADIKPVDDDTYKIVPNLEEITNSLLKISSRHFNNK